MGVLGLGDTDECVCESVMPLARMDVLSILRPVTIRSLCKEGIDANKIKC
jgi:hypothetical protein